jgi:CBS domain-containing protein
MRRAWCRGMTHRHLTVGDLMVTAVVTVRADEAIREAHADMVLGAFRHLPVLDERGRLVGILSDRDILRTLQRNRATTIAEVMTRDPITVRAEQHASLAARILIDRKIGALPVVNDDGALIGILTQTDFLDVARRALLALPLTE